MTRVLAILGVVLAMAGPAAASDQLRQLVAKDLKRLGFEEVDVNKLTSSQLSAIHAVANDGTRAPRGTIRSILGSGYNLRDLFR